MSSVHAPEPPIDNTPIFGDAPYTSGASFSCDAAQYAAYDSFYAVVGGNPFPPPPPPPPGGVLSVNGADGDVVIAGANGVAVSSGTSPTVSLGDIAPTKITASGTITAGGALTCTDSGTSFQDTMTAGDFTAAYLTIKNRTGGAITTLAELSGRGVNISGPASAASATISGALTAGSFTLPGAITATALTAGSLGATAPGAISYTTPGDYQMTIAGWKVQWGVSAPSALINGTDGSILISLTSERAYDGLYTIVVTPVILAGQAPFLCTVYQTPASYQFYLICRKPDNTPVNGAVVTWMTIGNAPP